MLCLDESSVLLDIQSRSKDGVLRELAGLLQKKCPDIETETLVTALREREALGSTGVGNGVALPHGKVAGLAEILYCFGRSREGVHFDAIDNQPAHYFFMILSPVNAAEEYLKTLAGASRLLKLADIRRRLRQAENKQTIIDIFAQAD